MVRAHSHPKETDRLLALYSYGVLDTEHDLSLDRLTALAARLCETPIALVSLVDSERQWFKSSFGFDLRETSRDLSLCAHAILEPGPMVVPDTLEDERFSDNALCRSGGDGLRFYAGVPLVGDELLPIGTLCVMDVVPRPDGLTPRQLDDLSLLAGQAMKLMELQRSLDRHRVSLKESVHRTKNVIAVASAIAARTISQADSLDEARAAMLDRLAALSKAQSFLMDAAGHGAPLRSLIERQLAAFFGPGDPRLQLGGDDVAIAGQAAEGIGLALHELVTNAIKHGALTVPEGKIDICWERLADGGLSLTWRETGGPSPKPAKKGGGQGFGSMVIGPLASQKIGGSATLTLPEGGAIWHAQVSAAHVMQVS